MQQSRKKDLRSPYLYTPSVNVSSKSRKAFTDSLPGFLFVMLIIFVYMGKSTTSNNSKVTSTLSKSPQIEQDNKLRTTGSLSSSSGVLVNSIQNKYAEYLEKKRVVIIHEEEERGGRRRRNESNSRNYCIILCRA
jgi:hypothetical protein